MGACCGRPSRTHLALPALFTNYYSTSDVALTELLYDADDVSSFGEDTGCEDPLINTEPLGLAQSPDEPFFSVRVRQWREQTYQPLDGDTPAEDTPAEDTPAEYTPAEDTPAEDTPAEDTPVEEYSPVERTALEELSPVDDAVFIIGE